MLKQHPKRAPKHPYYTAIIPASSVQKIAGNIVQNINNLFE